MIRPFATVILAGGKGTRMGSSDRHKVCFEVLGIPVILRALETYNVCGSRLNVIVVGMLAEKVMATVRSRFPGTAFAFQERQLGTGDAARKGAEILERAGFDGDVLVVAGDKLITPGVIRRLLKAHAQGQADVTLATTRRPPNSSGGILLRSSSGTICGILEEAERRRLIALGKVHTLLQGKPALPSAEVSAVALGECGEKTGRALLVELGLEPGADGELTRTEFERRLPKDDREGRVRAGDRVVPAAELLEQFDQVNLSTYLFRAPVLYDVLSRLTSSRASQEEYLTDVFELLARQKRPAQVIGCEIPDARELMAFNNPQELLAVEEVWRAR